MVCALGNYICSPCQLIEGWWNCSKNTITIILQVSMSYALVCISTTGRVSVLCKDFKIIFREHFDLEEQRNYSISLQAINLTFRIGFNRVSWWLQPPTTSCIRPNFRTTMAIFKTHSCVWIEQRVNMHILNTVHTCHWLIHTVVMIAGSPAATPSHEPARGGARHDAATSAFHWRPPKPHSCMLASGYLGLAHFSTSKKK